MERSGQDMVWCDVPAHFERDVCAAWLRGDGVEQAALARVAGEGRNYPGQDAALIRKLLVGDTRDSYRLFQNLEPYLQDPRLLVNQRVFSVPKAQLLELLRQYYVLEPQVARSMVGKRLKRLGRKELAAIAAKSGASLVSVQRQVDNVVRVTRLLKETEYRGAEHTLLERFQMADGLLSDYLQLAFLTLHQFEGNRKRVAAVRYEQLQSIAALMSLMWTENGGMKLDAAFAEDAGQLKGAFTKLVVEEYTRCVLAEPAAEVLTQTLGARPAAVFVQRLLKGVLAIGSSLGSQKLFRQFFEMLLELQAPFVKLQLTAEAHEQTLQLTAAGLGALFECLVEQLPPSVQQYREAWRKLLSPIAQSLKILQFGEEDRSAR